VERKTWHVERKNSRSRMQIRHLGDEKAITWCGTRYYTNFLTPLYFCTLKNKTKQNIKEMDSSLIYFFTLKNKTKRNKTLKRWIHHLFTSAL
jgi:hypothetical protein